MAVRGGAIRRGALRLIAPIAGCHWAGSEELQAGAPDASSKRETLLHELKVAGFADLQNEVGVKAPVNYPHEKFDVGTHEGRWLIRTQGVGFGSATLGAATIRDRYNADYDTYVAWPEGEVSPGSPDGWLKTLPTAPGMSGCGIWLVMHRDGSIWVPDKMRMVAIQHSWHEGERWLRGTQIQHWLRMVADDLPDLRAEIALAFPNLFGGQPA
jgi:hypothetical protein